MRGKATPSFWFIFITCYVFGSLSYKIGSKAMQVIKITACLGILALVGYQLGSRESVGVLHVELGSACYSLALNEIRTCISGLSGNAIDDWV